MKNFSSDNTFLNIIANKIKFVVCIKKSCIFAGLKAGDEKAYNK